MDTLVRIDRKFLLDLNDKELFKHILPESLRSVAGRVGGGDQKYKADLIDQLTQGQRSAFMFMVIYFHNVIGWNLFLYGFSREIKDGLFEKMKTGLEYIGDHQLLDILTRVEERYRILEKIDPHHTVFKDLDQEYEQQKEMSLNNAANFIKKHTEEFFVIKENDR